MKSPFHFPFIAGVMAAAFAALASAQEPPSSPPPKPQPTAGQTTADASKTIGRPGHGPYPFDHSLPEIVRASQVTEIVTVVVVFGCPVLIVALTVFGRYRRAELLHHTLRAMVEKGSAIPPELLVPPKPPANDFRRGVLLIGLGMGFIGLLALHAEKGTWSIGLVPLMLGVGYLVVAKLATKPPAGPGPTLPS